MTITDLLFVAMDVASQEEPTPAEQCAPAWTIDGRASEIPFDDPSNFTLLSMEDDFNLEYIQWATSLNI